MPGGCRRSRAEAGSATRRSTSPRPHRHGERAGGTEHLRVDRARPCDDDACDRPEPPEFAVHMSSTARSSRTSRAPAPRGGARGRCAGATGGQVLRRCGTTSRPRRDSSASGARPSTNIEQQFEALVHSDPRYRGVFCLWTRLLRRRLALAVSRGCAETASQSRSRVQGSSQRPGAGRWSTARDGQGASVSESAEADCPALGVDVGGVCGLDQLQEYLGRLR
jgi:hypothetical protein